MKLDSLKDFNWKRHFNTVLKVIMDFKVLGLFVLNGLVLYGIGWDTILRPSLESMKGRDSALSQQKKSLEAKESLQKQYGVLAKQLKSLDTIMIPVPAGNSAKVVSVTESAKLQKLVEGKLRDVNVLPPLQPPHDQRENISLTPTAESSLDILKLNGAAAGQSAGASQGAAPTGGDSGGASGPPGTPSSGPDGEMGTGGAATSMPVDQFDYDLKVTGTYPALMDVLNELAIWKTLVKINKITISKATVTEAQPDAKDYPDYPLKLDMVVSLSIFLYASNGAPH